METKNIHYTKAQIRKYLTCLKQCVMNERITISNREKNNRFIEEYHLYNEKRNEILMSLKEEDFCYTTKNYNKNYPEDILYVFCKECRLDNWGNIEEVKIYIKVNIIEIQKKEYTIVISMHPLEKKIKYVFDKKGVK